VNLKSLPGIFHNQNQINVMTDNKNTEIVQYSHGIGDMDIETAKHHYNNFNKFKKEICKENIDYGIIPGTQKPTLYKAGAEKLIKAFHLLTSVEEVSKTVDMETGFVDFEYKVYVKNKEGVIVGEGVGSCNSYEDKYLFTGWKAQKDKPSESEKFEQEKAGLGRFRKNGNNWEWCTRSKKNPHDLIALKNTIQKMAKKRAFVDACLMATGGGEFFTQDIEDLEILPDTNLIMDELRQVLKIALNGVKNRSELTKLYKACTVLQTDEGIHNDFIEKSNEFPEIKNG